MANDLLGVSVSGLRISQGGLSTVGHNIANSGTEGYSRQRIDPATNPATLFGGSYIGNGAHLQSVDRVVDQFVTDQLRLDSTLYADLNGYFEQVSQLDNLLSDASTGLSDGLNSFFSAVQNGTDDPSSLPARQLVLSESENLADRFNTIHERLGQIESGVNSGMKTAVSQINALTKNIAQLNLQITDKTGTGGSAMPNDLLDQRDEALRKLAELVPVQTFDQNNGQVNVVVGNGQSLVIGANARSLELNQSADNGGDTNVFFNNGSKSEDITGLIKGGELGGLIRFRDEMLSSVYNQLGRIAVGMAESFNQVHQQGIDLNDEFGGLFFYDINDSTIAQNRIIADGDNAKPDDRQLSLFIEDSKVMTSSDYRLELDGPTQYRITRLEDEEVVASGVMAGGFPFQVEFDGLKLQLDGGSFQQGDAFVLQPTRSAAANFASELIDAQSIAFASPIVTDASLQNQGNGVISAGEVLSLTDQNGESLPLFAESGEMSPPLVVVFRTPYSYDVMDNSDPGNPVHLEPPIRDQRYVPGSTQKLFSEQPGGTMVSTQGDMIGLPDGRAATPNVTGNGYPAELITLSRQVGGQSTDTNLQIPQNSSAREIANTLSNEPGVDANAFSYLELSDFELTRNDSLQLQLNGQNLLEYTVDPISGSQVISDNVPDPAAEPQAFYEYLAGRINQSEDFQDQKIHAVAGADELTGEMELRVHGAEGDDLIISLQAIAGDTLQVNDGENSPVDMDGQGVGTFSHITVGGRVDVSLAEGVALQTYSTDSMLFGDTSAENFARNTFLGIQATLDGKPQAGDTFTLNFNHDAASDNRVGLNLANLQNAKSTGSGATFSQRYGTLVERVGIETHSAKINRDAAERVLEQTTALRNSISGVNLDEEAADLIRFEQLFSANAQVISVARDIFDRLISSF